MPNVSVVLPVLVIVTGEGAVGVRGTVPKSMLAGSAEAAL